MKKYLLLLLVGSFLLKSWGTIAQPTFSSATTTSATNIRITFTTLNAHPLTAVGASTAFTVSGATITATAIVDANAGTIDLTVSSIASNFSCTNCVTLSAGAATNSDGASIASGPVSQNVTDGIAPTFSATSPVASSIVNTTTISYTLSENLTSGSITWTNTGGTADAGSPHIQALAGTELTSGAKTDITLSNNPVLVDGATYSITFDGTDATGNSALAVINTGITFDTTPPAFTATAPSSNATVNNTNVSYTLSENLTSGSITWTSTGGVADAASPHIQALAGTELTSGAKTDITLSTDPVLVDGATYSITFNGTDAAGNNATAVSNTDITFDTTPPVAPTTVTVTTTGGFLRNSFWNSTNTGVDLEITIPNDASLINGTVIIEARISTGSFTTITSSSSSTITSVNTTKTMSITATNILAITGYAQGKVLQFRARLSDAAGNGPSPNTQSTTSLTVDTSQPTISTSTYNANGVGKETMVLTFSETLDVTTGIPILGSPGFTVNQGAINTTGNTTFTGTGLTIESNFNGQWATNVQLTYTNSNNQTGNYVRDLAGNELATTTFSAGFFAPPVLATSMVLNPNGTGFETIVFSFDQPLNTTTSAGGVTGLTVNGSSFAGTYSTTGNTVTITSTADGQWSSSALVSYASGNLVGSPGASVSAFSNEPILLGPISLNSNNSNGSSIAKVGDVITLAFTANAAISATPSVTIGGLTATVGGSHPNYTANITATNAIASGPITFSIVATEASTRATTVTNSIPGSTVTFDKTPPNINPISITSLNTNTSFAKIGDIVNVTFTTSEALFGAPSVTIAGNTATLSNLGLTYTASVTIDNSYANAPLTFSINLQDQAGNVATATTTTNSTSVTIDKVFPVVSSIATNSSLKGIGTTNGIFGNSVNFLVTFTETNILLSGIDVSDFSLSKDATITAATISSVTGSGNTWNVTVNGIVGTGKLSLGLTDDDSILDAAGNPLGGTGAGNGNLATSFSGSQYYTITLAEPTNAVSALTTTTITSNSITVQWNQPVVGSQAATHYLILAKPTSGGTYPTVTDGTFISDALLIQNLANTGISPQTTTFTSLNSGTSYDIIIYPYTIGQNNSNDNIDFKTTSPATVTAATTFSSVSTLTFNSGGGLLSSNTTASPGQSLLSFTIQDDGTHIGADVLGDNSPFKFSNIIFNVGGTNNIAKWSEVIGGAQLEVGGTPIAATMVINDTNITFSSIASTTTTDPGFISDDASKQFTLKIWLKNDLSGTQNYPTIIDGLIFDFRVNNASIVYNNTSNNGQTSSKLVGGSIADSGSATVTVMASKLVFNTPGSSPTSTQPQSQIGVGIRFGLSASTQPTVYALDQNNNLDLGYSQTGTIDTPTSNLNPSITSLSFSAGVLSLSNLQFNIGGTSGVRVQAPSVTSVTSTNVTAVISNKTSLSAGPTIEPITISSLITSLSSAISPQQNAIQNFDFTITDDASANTSTFDDNDALPTLINQFSINQGLGNDPILVDWTKVIAGAELRTSLGILVGSSVNISSSSITFSGIANTTSTDPGHIADGNSKTYQLKIWLNTAIDISIADDIDNKDLVFSLDQSSVSIGSANTTSMLATTAISSGNGNNTILVLPSKFAFTTTAYTTTSISQNYDSPLNPQPVIKVQDQNGNRDLDYAGTPIVTTNNPSVYTLANPALTNITGTINFDADFQVTSSGNGPSGGTTTFMVSDGLLTSAASVPVTFSYSGSSDIIKQTVGFAYTTDILYASPTNQVSSITTTTGIEVERFSIRDGGSTANDSDGTPTVLNGITLNISNWGSLRTIALFDGNANLIEQDVASTIITSGANAGNITFSGFILSAADNSSKDLSVKVSFNAHNVIDNQIITVSVVSVSAKSTSSSQFGNTNPIGIQSILSPQENQIEVVATVIDFTTLPTSASVYVPITIIAQARDANANTDLDYNGTVSSFLTSPGSPTFITTNDPTGYFTAGMFTFPSNFQFTTGNNATTALILEGGPASTNASINASNLTSTTSTLNTSVTILTSFDSRLAGDPTYQFQPDINYINYQATTITSPSNSFEIARFLIQDGDPSKPYAGGTQRDIDGATTILKDFDVELFTNGSKLPIRTIAVYVNGAVVAQTAPGILISGKSTTSFLGVNIATPGDEQDVSVSILVTFLNNDNAILDNDPITLRISSTTQGNGSNFLPTAGYIGGVNGGLQTPATTNSGAVPNKIEVEATRLDFITQPSNTIAGINQPISLMVVAAQDASALIDLDYDKANSNPNYQAATITTSTIGAKLSSVNAIKPYNLFNNGVITFSEIKNNATLTNSLYYTSTGDGTIIVTANGLSSNDGISIACNNVEVIDTKVVGLVSPTGGITSSQNLKSGSQNNIIFGVTFSAPNNIGTEPNLKGFSILFDNPFVTSTSATLIPTNFKIYEYVGDISTGGLSTTNIINFGGTITTGQSYYNSSSSSKDLIQVTFPTPRSLSVKRSYFLSVDVSPTANNSSPKLTPSLLDMGYTSASNNYILTTSGSATANVVGKQYSFASTSPPKIVTSSPSAGQLNVDKNLKTITLNFDVPVVSFDGLAYLYKKSDNSLVATLNASTGIYVAPNAGTDPKTTITTAATQNLTFKIPSSTVLESDSIYYLGISKGSFNTADNTGVGIGDENSNFFGGITYNQTLYFKVASPNAPALTGTNSDKYFTSSNAITLNGIFDQRGTAFFIVVKKGDPAPSNAEINGTASYSGTAYKRGGFAIIEVSPNYQSATITVDWLVNNQQPIGDFDVWLYAENDAPSPVATTAAYSKYIDTKGVTSYPQISNLPSNTSPTATYTITIPAAITDVTIKKPIIQVCSDSPIIITDPIVITEGNLKNDFAGSGTQTLNILLPAGLLFYDNKAPLTVSLVGGDFGNVSPTINFINNTLVKINYLNTGNTSTDNIIISNLKILATLPDSTGFITKFSGNGIPSLPDGTTLATIGSKQYDGQPFTNSFTVENKNNLSSLPIPITNTVTVIPDNYSAKGYIQLIPTIPVGDYGPTSFSGANVTNDLLSLTSASKDNPFFITMNHTDMNGCISSSTVQYTIYDHTTAIKSLSQTQNSDGNINKITIANTNYPNQASAYPNPEKTLYNDLAGYGLVALVADTTILPAGARQIMKDTIGANWKRIIADIVETTSTTTIGGIAFKNYRIYYDSILNAKFNGIPVDPYDNFKQTIKQTNKYQRNEYWTGGSLGTIKFTGEYLNLADGETHIARTQNLEIFLPARPLIEIGSAPSAIDSVSIPGRNIAVFCEYGGDLNFTGYPKAKGGESTGTFVLTDIAGNKLSYKSAAFITNTDGTATFKPTLFNNNYSEIVVNYYFQQNSAPTPPKGTGIASLIIRIEPNPIASFTMSSSNPVISSPPTYTGCEGISVEFTSASTISHGDITKSKFYWNFDDLNAPSTQQNSNLSKPTHIYSKTNQYNPTLYVISSLGCSSLQQPTNGLAKNTISIGVIPKVDFTFNGISTNDTFYFNNNFQVEAGAVKDGIYRLEWDFGNNKYDSSKASKLRLTATNQYTDANNETKKTYTVALKATTNMGCTKTLNKQLVVLPYDTLNPGIASYDFETDQKWQTLTAATGLGSDTVQSSWQRGKPDSNFSLTTDNKQNIWKTSLKNTYSPSEKSYLYSPSFDLTNIAKPMVSFKSNYDFYGQDGVVLQYSVDSLNIVNPDKTWFTLGIYDATNPSGYHWYNDQSLSSNPGKQTTGNYGWTKNSPGWIESKHTLNVTQQTIQDNKIKIIKPANSKRVVFRFALGSLSVRSSNIYRTGFALDNFAIGERTRLVVVESFSNLGNKSGEETPASNLLKALNLTNFDNHDILNINYHVAFPNQDPFNLNNPTDPSSRALFYNITTSPRSRLDGFNGLKDSPNLDASGSTIDPLFSTWQNKYNLQQLKLADAKIDLTGITSDINGISIPISITPLIDLDTATTVLQVGVLEKSIYFNNVKPQSLALIPNENKTQLYSEFVLKKLLPTASGTKLKNQLSRNVTVNAGTFLWKIDSTVFYLPTNDLYAFAFLQNSKTGEIYQAQVAAIKNDPKVITGTETISVNDISVYPNPTSNEFTIELPSATTQTINYRLFDQTGRLVGSGIIGEGQTSKTISTHDFANGLYIIELYSESEKVLRKKVLVAHGE